MGDFREPTRFPIVYRKGELTKKRILHDWPHHVWTPQRPNGFGQLLDTMHAFCRSRDYHTAGIWWCFRNPDDADAFCEWLRQRSFR